MRIAVAVVALILLSMRALAEAPRHTPNFPHDAALEDLLNTLRDPELVALLSKLANLDTNYEQHLEELVERGLINSSEASKLAHYNPEKLSQLDPELQSRLAGLLEGRTLDSEELEELVKTLLELESLSRLDPYSFIALARAVGEGFRRLNLEVPSELSTSVLKNLIEVIHPDLSAAQSIVESVEVVEQSSTLSDLMKLPKQVMLSPPTPQVGLPESSLYAITLALAIPTIALLLARARVLERLTLKTGSLIASARVGSSMSDAISIYWESVKLIEKKLRVRIADCQTHREYLSLVRDAARSRSELERALNCFREITEIYEVSRFSHVENSDALLSRAREKLADLVKSLG